MKSDREIAVIVAGEEKCFWLEGKDKDPHFGECGCMGRKDGEPYCPCVMQQIERYVATVRRVLATNEG